MKWSYRIVILYLGFISLIGTLVFISSKQKVDLVSKDYYMQEINYQERLDAIANANELEESISHSVDQDQINLSIPMELLGNNFKGEIQFYCPANSDKDAKMPMAFDGNGKQAIATSKLNKGNYKMRLLWENGSKKYFEESVISIK